jgi:RNA polymerase sigma-70 factor (ECF subfamily)
MSMAETRKQEERRAREVPGEPEPDWGKLVIAARKGDQAAISELVEAAQPRLYRFCFYLCGNKPKAEDLCQEAFIKALSNLKKIKEPARFLSWLFRSTKNHFLDEVKAARNRESESIDSPDEEGGSAATRSEALKLDARQEGMVAVQEALSKLAQEDRFVLLLVDMEERSYQEAAEIIGISEAAVRSRLHRARKAFEELFFAR